MHHVIVGNGMAGVTCAQNIRRIEPDTHISIITDDHTPFYSRPGLMYHMMGLLKEWDLRIARDSFYDSLGAELRYDRATRIADDSNTLELESGSRMAFDRLLIATGSRSRRLSIPGTDLPGIHYMYTLSDCRRIMSESVKGMKAVVIGGGLLGAELAEVWRHAGLSVTWLVLEPWYFPKGLSEQQGRIVEAAIRRHGCDVHMNIDTAEFKGDSRVHQVIAKSGETFDADIVGVTIGVEPSVDLANASGIGTRRGVLVDSMLRTSRADVFAAGDCAEIGPKDSEHTSVEQLWYSADRQARAAARNMCGDSAPYDPGLFYNTAKFFDVDYVSIGAGRRPDDGQDEETVVSRKGRAARRLVHRNGIITGITSIGFSDDPRRIMDIVREGASLSAVRRGGSELRERAWPW